MVEDRLIIFTGRLLVAEPQLAPAVVAPGIELARAGQCQPGGRLVAGGWRRVVLEANKNERAALY